jgi:hypothetical protein
MTTYTYADIAEALEVRLEQEKQMGAGGRDFQLLRDVFDSFLVQIIK